MATVNTANVFVGAPDQVTTGAVLTAPVGTALPTDAVTALDNAYKSGGYIDENGVQITPTLSTKDIKDWNGVVVKRLISEFKGDFKYASLELSYEAACQILGKDYVAEVAANAQHGKQLALKFGKHLPPVQSWVINMKDGDARVRLVIPKGQAMGQNGSITFKSDNVILLTTTVACYDDGTGNSFYIYTDDGLKAAA